ncbi:MAG: hypothetical protein ACLTFB_00880 [Candidatus Phytoplasma pyri]
MAEKKEPIKLFLTRSQVQMLNKKNLNQVKKNKQAVSKVNKNFNLFQRNTKVVKSHYVQQPRIVRKLKKTIILEE